MPAVPPAALRPADEAIWEQDAASLQAALASGWRPPTIHIPSRQSQDAFAPALPPRTVPNVSLLIRVVTTGWLEGWILLRQAIPSLATNDGLWRAALRTAKADIVRDMLEHGASATVPLEDGWYPVHFTLAALGNQAFSGMQVGEPVREEDIGATVEVLRQAGASLEIPYPGSFHPGSISWAGHTAWTIAAAARAWDLADQWLPSSLEEQLRHLRHKDAINALLNDARRGHAPARTAFVNWCNVLGPESWVLPEDGEDGFYPNLETPLDWPLIALLSGATRQALWERWARPDEAGWTILHQAMVHAEHSDPGPLLALIKDDQGACLDAWNQPDDADVTPADLLAMATHAPRPSRPAPWPGD